MPNVIQLLPENVANQIAAGEVIQRPSSAVKELMENAIDAKASKIDLVIKDAGKTLIQVIDNGIGMSNEDATLSFQRHATSKIKLANDLYQVNTKGFRGEALASIAAIAQVELKTKRKEDELGFKIKIEGSNITSKENISCTTGSNISMKNLFFNVPARRNFLKSDAVETKHIIDEFQRLVLAHPEIHFTMHNNKQVVFDLPKATVKQRIINVFGKKYNERLVPVQEKTSITEISGFILKPEHSKRTRGEQFFFANNRFIKSPYLNHAVNQAFKELISKEQHPSYFIFLSIPKETIDINIHPTKTEIKFQDERSIYAIIRSTVKSSLGKYSISPSLDFNQETSFNVRPLNPGESIEPPSIKINPNYNPFKKENNISPQAIENSIDILKGADTEFSSHNEVISNDVPNQNWGGLLEAAAKENHFQLENKYIVTIVNSSLYIIDQHRAHQQVLFEQFLESLSEKKASTQQLIFPINLELSASDYQLSLELMENMKEIGFEIDDFGNRTIVINGLPAGVDQNNSKALIESFLEEFKQSSGLLKNDQEKFAWSFAKGSAIKGGRNLNNKEIKTLIDELLATKSPYVNAKGNNIISKLTLDEIVQLFNKR